MIHTVKGIGIVNKAEVDVFLELFCFFNDPTDVGNLNSDSSAFSKSSLNTCKFLVHVLLKPGLENFENYFARVLRWVQLCSSLSILWHCLSLQLEWKLTFSSPVATAEFSKFAGILSAALSQHHLSGFEIAQLEFYHLHLLCSSWCFLRPTWLHIPGCLALGQWSHHHDYLGREALFCIVLLYSCHLFLISSASVRSILFLSFIEPILAWNVPLVSLIFLKRSLVFPILLFSSIS